MTEPLEPGEAVEAWGAAKWRENPYTESAEDSEGFLYLTTSRLIFETDRVKPFVSLGLDSFESATVSAGGRGVQLVLVDVDGRERKSFWCDLDLAEQVAAAIRASTAL
jgi:hypothetical protein